MSYDVPETVRGATEAALAAAEHLTPTDLGVIATLLKLADRIDYLTTHDGVSEEGKFDNVSIPTYLKYAESLGLTPAARLRAKGPKELPKNNTGLTALQVGVTNIRRR